MRTVSGRSSSRSLSTMRETNRIVRALTLPWKRRVRMASFFSRAMMGLAKTAASSRLPSSAEWSVSTSWSTVSTLPWASASS